MPGAATGAPASRRLAQLAETSVGSLEGIGPRAVTALSAVGISSVLDLLTYYPRRYADRTNTVAISELVIGVSASVRATVQSVQLVRPRGRRPFVQMTVADDGIEMNVTFFNQPWRARQLSSEMELVLYGRADTFRDRLTMTNPRLDIVGDRDGFKETGRIVPIYPQSDKAGIQSFQIARYVDRALSFADSVDAFSDPISETRRAEINVISRAEAFHAIHAPNSPEQREKARRRLAFDELLRMQFVLVMRKHAALATARGIAHSVNDTEESLVTRFIRALPFPLTGAQQRSLHTIAVDLASPHPMHRLLQGDVGSGKTVVALASLLYAIEGGHQGALMVPTEVLAEQHFLAARSLLAGLEVSDPARLSGRRPVTVALITSRTPGAERTRLVNELHAGSVDLLVGTHALLTDDIRFSSLGVVVIDEQHRFGVDQRAALREKGSSTGERDPDLLVMTATPIPRTAAMTVYGDLDMSALDEMPVGRTPIATRWIDDPSDDEVAWERLREEVAKGNAAYVVCPLVRPGAEEEEGDEDVLAVAEASDDGQLFDTPRRRGMPVDPNEKRVMRAATDEIVRLQKNELAGLRVGLLHGQLPAKDKESVMESFRAGKLDVLVATTVIEVGVDVPRATVMVIEDADRFGIAQLHQLRGRVGRSDAASYCFLLAPALTPEAQIRLEAIEATTDGFELADVDLELRGEGAVFGVRQKGRSELRLASLRRDEDLVKYARAIADEVVVVDPNLANHPRFSEELRAFIDDEQADYLLRS